MNIAKNTASYLGIYIAENVLGRYFNDVKRMPNGNPGFDFICKLGYKIDAKCSCLHPGKRGSPYWEFAIRRNKTPDYFAWLAFDNRRDLTPIHIWIVPGKEINCYRHITITDTSRCLARWEKFERPIEKIFNVCETVRVAGVA